MMEEKQTDRLVSMMFWLTENPAYREALCGFSECSGREVFELTKILAEKKYYEFLLVLLLKSRTNQSVECAIAEYLVNRVSGKFYENGIEEEITVFVGFLETELEQRDSQIFDRGLR